SIPGLAGQLTALGPLRWRILPKLSARLSAGFDPPTQPGLLVFVQHGITPDVAEIQAKEVLLVVRCVTRCAHAHVPVQRPRTTANEPGGSDPPACETPKPISHHVPAPKTARWTKPADTHCERSRTLRVFFSTRSRSGGGAKGRGSRQAGRAASRV